MVGESKNPQSDSAAEDNSRKPRDARLDAAAPDEPQREDYHDDEELDPELLKLATAGQRGSVLRLLLFGIVIWFGLSLISDWEMQLRYFFSPSEPVELGNVLDFASKKAQDPDFTPEIPDNRYVSLSGVPSRRAQSSNYQYFKLVGSDIFVETRRDDADLTELERLSESTKSDVDRTYFKGAGRARRLSAHPDAYQGLRGYYARNYHTYLCETPLDAQQQRHLQQSEEDCVDGYIIEDGIAPGDHWWYVLFSSITALFVLLNIWWAIRWVRDFLRS